MLYILAMRALATCVASQCVEGSYKFRRGDLLFSFINLSTQTLLKQPAGATVALHLRILAEVYLAKVAKQRLLGDRGKIASRKTRHLLNTRSLRRYQPVKRTKMSRIYITTTWFSQIKSLQLRSLSSVRVPNLLTRAREKKRATSNKDS